MPRPARLPFIPFGWYYVVLRSVANRKIVTKEADLATLLKLLRVTVRRKGARLHACYVAENEVHLVLQAGEERLSAITSSFQHEYARVFNQVHEEHGSLFRLHHHVLLFQHERWLVRLVHFIHWIHRLQAPAGYPQGLWWSSDAVYRGSTKQEGLTTHVVLHMLTRGAYDRQAQEEAYRRLFDRAPEPGDVQSFKHGSAEDRRLLGDTQFVAEIRRRTGRGSADRTWRAHSLQGDISAVVTRAIEQFKALCAEGLPRRQAENWRRLATYENVRSKLRKRPLPLLRALSVAHLVDHDMATVVQAARFLGCSPRSVSARRRRVYEALFLDLFGVMPEILFTRRRGGDEG